MGTCPGKESPLRFQSYRNKSSGQFHGCWVDLVHVFFPSADFRGNFLKPYKYWPLSEAGNMKQNKVSNNSVAMNCTWEQTVPVRSNCTLSCNPASCPESPHLRISGLLFLSFLFQGTSLFSVTISLKQKSQGLPGK